MIKVKYKAISNRLPYKVDWHTVKEFFEANGHEYKINSESRWTIENGTAYMERSYKTSDEWETSIKEYHKSARPLREYRFEIVEEINGDENGISS